MKKIVLLLLFLYTSAIAGDMNISGTTNTEDAVLNANNPDDNYGGTTGMGLRINDRFIFRVNGLAGLIGSGQQIDACSLYFYQYAADGLGAEDSLYAWRVFKPWVEGVSDAANALTGVTYLDWECDDYEWGSSGCNSASDVGDDNSTDGGGYDRAATPVGKAALTASSGWKVISLGNLGQGWYDGTIDENGFAIGATFSSGEYIYIYSSEYTTNPDLIPYVKVWYSSIAIKLMVKNRP